MAEITIREIIDPPIRKGVPVTMPSAAVIRQYAEVFHRLRPGQTVRLHRNRKGGPVLIVQTVDEIIPLVPDL
jgi:hypothetical protein